MLFLENIAQYIHRLYMGFPCGSVVKNLSNKTGDMGSIPGSGRSSGEGNAVSLLGKSHGHRSLAGCNPWGHNSSI